MNGIVVIDKPEGPTSHDVVNRVRRITGEKRVGHTGTLDPFATGVLAILIGRATRLARFVSAREKEYEGVIRLGVSTDTGDSTGAIYDRSALSPSDITEEALQAAMSKFEGTIMQEAPMYSAKRVHGQRLYSLARAGKQIPREPLRVEITKFVLTGLRGFRLTPHEDGTCDVPFRVACSAGTYIRSLAVDLGAALGTVGHLLSLRRVRVGRFEISQAKTLERFENEFSHSREKSILPMHEAVSGMPSRNLTPEETRAVENGVPVAGGFMEIKLSDGDFVSMFASDQRLIGIGVYDRDANLLRPRIIVSEQK